MPDLESEYEGTVDLAYLSTKEQRIKTARSSIKIVKKYLDHGSSLLDVGCNTGYFLDVASEKFDVQGIELSNWSADLAAINHLVHRVPLSALQVKSKYDGITLSA
jgi:cyclopropane fatty-acyl-phospholipid synthase-like methyltransferase